MRDGRDFISLFYCVRNHFDLIKSLSYLCPFYKLAPLKTLIFVIQIFVLKLYHILHLLINLLDYRHKDYPYIKFNFDGVIDKLYNEDGTYQYIPDEIKVVTMFGMKHYQPKKATFSEFTGWNIIPPHYEKENWTIDKKAEAYGIPPYYYTQLQQQIFGLKAPYGFLTVLFERDWQIHSWLVWRDQKTINQIIIEDTKTWNLIEQKRPKNFDLGVEIKS